MRFSYVLAGALGWAMHPAAARVPSPNDDVGIPMPEDFSQLQQNYLDSQWRAMRDSGCSEDNIRVRRSWDQLSDGDRSKYIDAVKCLTQKPATIDKTFAPGIVNRLDDFVFIHINQTLVSHQTV
jgi:tyrosinase